MATEISFIVLMYFPCLRVKAKTGCYFKSSDFILKEDFSVSALDILGQVIFVGVLSCALWEVY